MTICPRCYGSSAVVCCALCKDVRLVSESVDRKYRELKVQSVGATLQLREAETNK